MPHDNTATLSALVCALDHATRAAPVLATAGDDASGALSGADVARFARRFAACAQLAGLQRQDCIAVALPTGVPLATGCLAAASVGACAPLDVDVPTEVFARTLESVDARAALLDTEHGPLADAARSVGAQVLAVPATRTDEVPLPACAPEDVALVLTTSGTTGKPKRVGLTHAHILHSARTIADTLTLSPGDMCLSPMPLHHIHGLVGCLFATLVSGGRLLCQPRFDADGFLDALMRERPTWYSAVPTLHGAIVDAAGGRRVEHTLRFVRSSSSALAPSLLTRLEEVFGVAVVEAYGMTEAAHQMASNPLPPGVAKAGSVGVATGTELRVTDAAGNCCQPGEPGAVWVRGASVVGAYLTPGDDDATFDDGWLRTGDLGWLDADGYLFLRGREKEMINRGGETIAPRAIEEALVAHGAVREAVVFGVAHASLGEDVVAAVATTPDCDADERALRLYAGERLSPAQVPTRVLVVDALPRLASGKLMRAGLEAHFAALLGRERVTPRNAFEEAVAAQFAETLGVMDVGATDNFFSLGGDSIAATRCLSALSADFGIDLPTVSLFHNPTVEEMGRELLAQLASQIEDFDALLDDVEGDDPAHA